MTDDAFTTAANKSAWEKYQGDWDPAEQVPVDDWGYTGVQRQAHVEGWVAARDHLAAQEPTDAEVEAAAEALYGDDPAWGFIVEFNYGTQAVDWDDIGEAGQTEFRRLARAALAAARAVRQEKR